MLVERSKYDRNSGWRRLLELLMWTKCASGIKLFCSTTALNIDPRWMSPIKLAECIRRVCSIVLFAQGAMHALCEVQRFFPQNVTEIWQPFKSSASISWICPEPISGLPMLPSSFPSHFFLFESSFCPPQIELFHPGEGVNNKMIKMSHKRSSRKTSMWSYWLYSRSHTRWSTWATCFLRLSIPPAELRPFFLYLGTNLSLAIGS